MSDLNRKWLYLIVLSIIWGTSYILIKKGLEGFSPIQLGVLRIIIAALLLFLIGFKTMRQITRQEWKWVAVSGIVGSFIPVFLFAFAQTQIDSSIASILNSLVPLFTIVVGSLAFRTAFKRNQLLGVVVGLAGATLLVSIGAKINPGQNYWYAGFVILATICYAFNANIIKSKLYDVSPLGIAVGNFAKGEYFLSSLGYIVILCVIGTCVAKVMFNKLIHISSPVFSVSVTYLIPVVGIFWGLMDGENLVLQQFLATCIIIFGVYLINRQKAK